MQWTRKPDFQEVLKAQMNLAKQNYTYSDYRPIFVNIEIPKVSIPVNIGNIYGRASSENLQARSAKYLAGLSEKEKKAWAVFLDLSTKYKVEGIYPWQPKDAFKVLVKRLHPDYNRNIDASSDFQQLFKAYKALS